MILSNTDILQIMWITTKFKSLTESIFLINCFVIFFIYIKISKKLSRKYHQENKERPQKKLAKNIKIFLKNKKKKKPQYGHERYKNLSKDNDKSLLSIEKIL